MLDTHAAIIGTSGAGKSTTARVAVEELLSAGRHVCIIDPTGGWWGMVRNGVVISQPDGRLALAQPLPGEAA